MTNAINITNFHCRKPCCKSFVELGELLVSSSIIIRSVDICQYNLSAKHNIHKQHLV